MRTRTNKNSIIILVNDYIKLIGEREKRNILFRLSRVQNLHNKY